MTEPRICACCDEWYVPWCRRAAATELACSPCMSAGCDPEECRKPEEAEPEAQRVSA